MTPPPDDQTRLSTGDHDETRLGQGDGDMTRTSTSPSSPASATSGQGWFTTSGAIDHGRFSPGAVLEGRYRIVGLLGRGGMGEVYRADDLRLGQQVAIKFLPAGISADTHRLAQFHNEVRMARQVTHPNVCRVHDIGEIATSAGAQLFITMEYIDGEDLAASLKRVGRFPEDKALDIARQIAAGLAAAHDRGVIHRDLKPANIMLDREGHVRLMDFGLAAAGAAEDVQAGTPAYMAPEQLLGKEVTRRSDIFALGLVLYELFTGKRVFMAKTVADLVAQQDAGVTTMPSDIVKGLDPSIERAIVWCLQRDPAARPDSALTLSAALPGGDPLAAALAAGETPSPEMVAAAGRREPGLSVLASSLWLALALAMLVTAGALADRFTLPARAPMALSPASLLDRARGMRHLFTEQATVTDEASGLVSADNVLDWIHRAPAAEQSRLYAAGAPPTLMFWYRSSAGALIPDGDTVGMQNPPLNAEGTTMIALDGRGRLFRFGSGLGDSLRPGTPRTWAEWIGIAGFDPTGFVETEPQLLPPVYADARAAFTGTLPELPNVPIRFELATSRHHLVSFRVMGPWNAPAAPVGPAVLAESPNTANLISKIAAVLVVPGVMLAGFLVARYQMRRGRGDRVGAGRLFSASLVISVVAWAFAAHHPPSATLEIDHFFSALAHRVFDAGVLWVFYLAAEPQVRRVWPHILITWQRLISTGPRDPLIGRDLVIGVALGGVMTSLSYLHFFTPSFAGLVPFIPHVPNLGPLTETRLIYSTLLQKAAESLENAMLGVVGLSMLRLVLRRSWLVFAAATLLFAPLAMRGQFQSGVLAADAVFGVLLVAAILGVIIRFGLLAGMVAFFTHFWTFNMPITLSAAQPYFQTSLFALGLVAAMAIAGVWLARTPDFTIAARRP